MLYDGDELVVTRKWEGGGSRESVYYSVNKIGSQKCFAYYAPTIMNAYSALAERVFNVERCEEGEIVLQHPPKPTVPWMISCRMEFEQFRSLAQPERALSRKEFVACYEGMGRKHTIYENARQSLEKLGVHSRDAWIKAFVKAEKMALKEGGVMGCPRIIQPREPRFNVEVGRFLKKLEKPTFRLLAKMTDQQLPCVLKGYNARETGNLMRDKAARFENMAAIGLDAARFDQHVAAETLQFEHKFYELFYSGMQRKKLQRLLKMQVQNQGRVVCEDGMLRYKVLGSRMSGDMNTSLGNCLIMCVMVFQAMRELGITKYELCNNGDDCVIMVEREHAGVVTEGIPRLMIQHGFTIVMEPPVYELEEIEFCQTHPVRINEQNDYIMVRNLQTSISKDATTILPVSSVGAFRKYCQAIGDCGLSLAGGVPIFQDYYSMYRRHGDASNITRQEYWQTGMAQMAKGVNGKYVDNISPCVRLSFWRAFGILPDEQMVMERLYRDQKFHIDGIPRDASVRECVYLLAPHPSYEHAE
jgi:hypothetical protein